MLYVVDLRHHQRLHLCVDHLVFISLDWRIRVCVCLVLLVREEVLKMTWRDHPEQSVAAFVLRVLVHLLRLEVLEVQVQIRNVVALRHDLELYLRPALTYPAVGCYLQLYQVLVLHTRTLQ